jgi:hypothetical protein
LEEESLEAQLGQVLQPTQVKRLDQILAQNLAVTSAGPEPVATVLPPARAGRAPAGKLSVLLVYPPAVKALGLSEAQRKQAVTIIRDYPCVIELISSDLGPNGLDRLMSSALNAFAERAEGRLGDLLTEKQQARVKELLGEPFRGLGPAARRGRGAAGATVERRHADFGRNALTTASFVVRYGPSSRSMQ